MKIARMVLVSLLLLASLFAVFQPAATLAQDGDAIELICNYPKVEAVSGSSFSFDVEIIYEGSEARVFDLTTQGPDNWTVSISQIYATDTKISAIRLEPKEGSGTKIKITANSPYRPLSEPGEYNITTTVSSGEITGSIELTAVITARYSLATVPSEGIYSTQATAGKDNYYSIEVQNLGTAVIEDITFSTHKPTGWSVTLSPDKVDSLPAGTYQTVDVNITPTSKTIAGDYEIVINTSGKQASADVLKIRVTVQTPPVGQWVGVGIIIVVIGGLIFVFMRFSRR